MLKLIKNRTGVNVEISKIFVRNPEKYSHITLPETAQYVTDIDEVLKDEIHSNGCGINGWYNLC